jgi:hypothetical protein
MSEQIKPISKNKFRILCRSIIKQVISNKINNTWKTIGILLGDSAEYKLEINNDLYSYGQSNPNIRLRYELLEKFERFGQYSYRLHSNTFEDIYKQLKDVELLNGLDFVLEEQIMLEL